MSVPVNTELLIKKDFVQFNNRIERLFAAELLRSDFLKNMVRVLKATRITEIDYSMGMYLVRINGESEQLSETDLEGIWDTAGIEEDSDEEPTELVYQKELDALNFYIDMVSNNPLIESVFYYEFETAINLAIKQ